MVNNQNTDVYVAYLGDEDGSQTMFATLTAFYKLSTDDLDTWGSQTAYSSFPDDDYRAISSGRSVGNAGGRWMPAFFDDDRNDFSVQDGNDVEIAAAGGAADPIPDRITQIDLAVQHASLY